MSGHLTPDRMIQMAATHIARNPQIAECTAQSLMGAVLQASLLDFKPIAALGECYFVPYNNKVKQADGREVWRKEVQFQIGYKGWMTLARRCRRIKSFYAHPVYEGDEFSYELGLQQTMRHQPCGRIGKVTHAYAVAHIEDADPVFVVLTREQIEHLRLKNAHQKADPSGAWKTDYAAMACAKAVKQLIKWLPLEDGDSNAERLQKAAAVDEGIARHDVNDDSLDADYFIEEVEHPESGTDVKEPSFNDASSNGAPGGGGLFGRSASKRDTSHDAIAE
jgi:recombination protein RecT